MQHMRKEEKKHVYITSWTNCCKITSSWVKKTITSQVLILFAIFPTFTLVRIVRSSDRDSDRRVVGSLDPGPRTPQQLRTHMLTWRTGLPCSSTSPGSCYLAFTPVQFDLHGSVEKSGKVCNPLLQPKYR